MQDSIPLEALTEAPSPLLADPNKDWSIPPKVQPYSNYGATGYLIPTSNPRALVAYYLGILGLLPVLGILVSPVALFFGVRGLQECKRIPGLPGKVHAWIGISLGSLSILLHFAGLLAILVARNSTGQ